MRMQKNKKDVGVRLKALMKIIIYFLFIAVPVCAGFCSYKDIAYAENNVTVDSATVQEFTETTSDILSLDASVKIAKPVPSAIFQQDDKNNIKGIWIKIIKHKHRLYVMEDDKVIKNYEVAVGKNRGQKERAGDNRTPEGKFSVQQIQNASYWTHDFKDGKGVIKGAYGPWFIRLKTGWNGIGIHGTHNPVSIGTNDTEGCIRLHNKDLVELNKLFIKIELPVVISE